MRIAQASITENNDDGWNRKAKAGDQTGREVFVRKWYPYDWDGIIHCLDANISNKAAEIAIKLANSNCPKKIDIVQIMADSTIYRFLKLVLLFKKLYPADMAVVNMALNINPP